VSQNIDDKDWDLVDLISYQNNGTFIKGQAVLCDLDGRHERLNFTYVRGDAEAAIFPEPYNTLSAVEWIHTHGMADFLSDLKEELDVARDRNRERDTMGKLIGFVFKGQS
jgi:hypothetical protein